MKSVRKILGESTLARKAAVFLILVFLEVIRAGALTTTWGVPAPGGTFNYTINQVNANTITITCNSCQLNNGLNLSMGITYQTPVAGQIVSGGVPAISGGQTSAPIPAPALLAFRAVHFDGTGAFDYIQTGFNSATSFYEGSGTGAAPAVSKTARGRFLGSYGEPVQLATGAEDSDRTLFKFHGARDWNFDLHYDSILASIPGNTGIFGAGWNSDFESSVVATPNGNLTVFLDATRNDVFTPVSGQPNAYTSVDDAARYESLNAQPGGGWILVHKDQSSQVFNSAGQLVQDVDPHGRALQLSYSGGRLSGIVEPISNTSVTFTYNSDGLVSGIADAAGASVNLTYTLDNGMSVGSIESVTDQNGNVTSYVYDDSDELMSETDDEGNTLFLNTYDSFGCVLSQLGGNGVPSGAIQRTESGTYPNEFIISVSLKDRAGFNESYLYDGSYNLLSQNGPGPAKSFVYDSSNRMITGGYVGNLYQYAYDSLGNLTSSTDPLGNATQYTYDSHNNLLTIVDAAARTTTLTYDSNNNILSITNPASGTMSWTYDSNSLPLTKTVPKGGVYHYVYTNGRLSQATDPSGVVDTFAYDSDGRITSHTDTAGNRNTWTYDLGGNRTSVTNALGQQTNYAFDFRNRLASITDPTGSEATLAYDPDNNIVGMTDALGNHSTYAYDSDDHLQTAKDPLGRTTTYAVDGEGKVLAVADPLGHTTSLTYDSSDRLALSTDTEGETTSMAYDARGLLTGVTDPNGHTRTQTFDNVGRVSTSTDPIARTTQYVYDALDRLTQVTDPGGLIISNGYDGDSNRTALTDQNSHVTGFTFDASDRLTQFTTATGRASNLSYNAIGLPQSTTEPSGKMTSISYDTAHRVSSVSDPVGTKTYTRDADGRILTIAENGKTITRTYDRMGRLISIIDGSGNTIGYQYDAAGQLTQLTYPGGLVVTYTYDAAGRLTTVTDWAGRITTYTYDSVNRLVQITRPNGTTQKRTYDLASQLLSLTDLAPDGVTILYSEQSTFDAAGQLVSETTSPSTPAAPPNATQTFDPDNRLLTHNGASTTLDLDGNLISVATGVAPATYTYDARNRLVSADSTSYSYDAENRRISTTDGTGTTAFAINPNATFDQVLVRTAPSGTQTFYVYGLGLSYEVTGASVHYYHANRLGNTVALSDSTGAVTDTASYDAYGAVASRTGTTATPFLFAGLLGIQSDSDGLYFCRARYYHPVLRRWLTRDPIGESGGINLYAYAGDNPITNVDPSGHSFGTWVMSAIGFDPNARYSISSLAALDAADQQALLGDSGISYNCFPPNLMANAAGVIIDQVAIQLTISVATDGLSGLLSNGGRAFIEESAAIEETASFEEAAVAEEKMAAQESQLAGWSARDINAAGGSMNCVNCATAMDATLAGNPASALLGGPKDITVLGRDWAPVTGQTHVESLLLEAGEGARGIVYGEGDEYGHVWNAVNQGGEINFIDAQTGGNGAQNFQSLSNFLFLRTH